MWRSGRGEASVARRAKQAYSPYVDAARQSHAQVQPARNATYGLWVLLDRSGNFLATWKLTENGQPEMYSPSRVATAADRAYFVDTSNDRIVVLKISPAS